MVGPPLLVLLLLFVINTTRSEVEINNDISYNWKPFYKPIGWNGIQKLPSKRHLDLSYGNRAYSDCVCGLPSQSHHRAPRQQITVEDDDGRVVGGEEAVPHSLPWMALLFAEPKETPICGATIISDRYVISAAHCIDSSFTQKDLKVVLGEHDHCLRDHRTTRFSVNRILIHPAFRHQDYFADIMLLRLSMRVTFSRFVRPICLPSLGASFEGALALVSGWGTANFSDGNVQCTLQQASLPVLPREICIQSSPETAHETLLCAGYLGEGGRDSCQGDSGGPLQLLHPQTHRFTLIGVVSNGVGCGLADYPGFYTTVSQFITWILSTTQDSAYCFL